MVRSLADRTFQLSDPQRLPFFQRMLHLRLHHPGRQRTRGEVQEHHRRARERLPGVEGRHGLKELRLRRDGLIAVLLQGGLPR